MSLLPDGTYETMVVDVLPADGAPGARLELVILGSVRKGEVVAVRSDGVDPEDLGVLGCGATLTVVDGAPSVVLGD